MRELPGIAADRPDEVRHGEVAESVDHLAHLLGGHALLDLAPGLPWPVDVLAAFLAAVEQFLDDQTLHHRLDGGVRLAAVQVPDAAGDIQLALRPHDVENRQLKWPEVSRQALTPCIPR